MRSTKIVSISVLPKTLRQIDQAATAEQRTRSQFINRAVERVIRADSARSHMEDKTVDIVAGTKRRFADQHEADQRRAAAMRENGSASVAENVRMPNGRPGDQSK